MVMSLCRFPKHRGLKALNDIHRPTDVPDQGLATRGKHGNTVGTRQFPRCLRGGTFEICVLKNELM